MNAYNWMLHNGDMYERRVVAGKCPRDTGSKYNDVPEASDMSVGISGSNGETRDETATS